MAKYIPLFLISIIITGCARTTLLMEMEGVEPLLGEATGSLVHGSFELENMQGLACKGSYNPYSQSRKLKAKVQCSDGRTGEVIVLRTGRNLVNGSGTGILSDGTKFRVLLGDMVHYRGAQGYWDKVETEEK